MYAKNGQVVPYALNTALKAHPYALKVFAAMRPSCQQKYMNRARLAPGGKRNERVYAIVRAIIDYGHRHTNTAN